MDRKHFPRHKRLNHWQRWKSFKPRNNEWLSGGILSTGCNVIDIGIVTSPMFYHSTFVLESASGVVITGSHNPAEYNGFKVVFNNQSTSSEEILLLKKEY